MALSTQVTRVTPSTGAPWPRTRAVSKARRTTRSVPLRVITRVSTASSSPTFEPPPSEAKRPSVFSRKIT